ncbi:MAG: MFS transporter [Pseudolabrys sp.]|nr:MFS transporter [Pseudolabrys sp.]
MQANIDTKTNWTAVAALLAAGVIVALQIGKAVIAVPVVQKELAMSLTLASWIIGTYGLLGALVGLPAGIAMSLYSGKRALIVALLLCGTGSLAGAWATSGAFLIATRVLEGCGFLIAVIAIPRLLRIVTTQRDSGPVLAVWGAYMPTGSLLMILTGPHLMAHGWQTMWLVNGAIVIAFVAVIALIDFREPPPGTRALGAIIGNVRAAVAQPGPLLLSVIFGIYTFQYAAMVGLLPVLLVDRMGLSVATAGALGAIAVAGNAIGNVSAGALVRFGIPIWAAAIAAFIFVGFAGYGVFGNVLPPTGVALLAAVSLAMTGLIPASVFAAAPNFARDSAVLAITLGLLTQASNVGNLLGPAAMASVVERAGWDYAPLLFVGVGVCGVAAASMLRAVMTRSR